MHAARERWGVYTKGTLTPLTNLEELGELPAGTFVRMLFYVGLALLLDVHVLFVVGLLDGLIHIGLDWRKDLHESVVDGSCDEE
jgi:hypothetical protein